MPRWLDEFVFRHTVINDILVRSGQRRPSLWLQVQYGFWSACPYLVLCAAVLVIAFAAYLYSRNEFCVYLGGASVSLIALLYGLFVSPLRGAMPAIERFVTRSQRNNVRSDIIAQNIPGVIDTVNRQVSALNAIYWITSIMLFLAGLTIGGLGFLF